MGRVADLGDRMRVIRQRVPQRAAARSGACEFELQLLIVEVGESVFIIDGVIRKSNGSDEHLGWPVSISLRRTDDEATDSWVATLLSRWCAEDSIVRCRIASGRRWQGVAIDNADRQLTLRLHCWLGLSESNA